MTSEEVIRRAKAWYDAISEVVTPGSPADEFIKAYEEWERGNREEQVLP